jgi:hypothetical protein
MLVQIDSGIVCSSRRLATAVKVAVGVKGYSKSPHRSRDFGAELEFRSEIQQWDDHYQSAQEF